jgi:2-dehydro-3-deoxyphosphogalactonate aldolase
MSRAVADARCGTFVVSPDTNVGSHHRHRRGGLTSYPGVFTPTDAFTAIRAGATGLKFFPAEVLGTKGIKAMKAVLPPTDPVYAVGGANPDNFSRVLRRRLHRLRPRDLHLQARHER